MPADCVGRRAAAVAAASLRGIAAIGMADRARRLGPGIVEASPATTFLAVDDRRRQSSPLDRTGERWPRAIGLTVATIADRRAHSWSSLLIVRCRSSAMPGCRLVGRCRHRRPTVAVVALGRRGLARSIGAES